MRKYSPKLPKDYAESAIEVIRHLVAAHRGTGMGTRAALEVIAPELEMPLRRPRRLFERDRDPHVGIDEYSRLLFLGARILRRIADHLRERADRWDAEADLLEIKHRQLSLWNGAGEWTLRGGAPPQRRAA